MKNKEIFNSEQSANHNVENQKWIDNHKIAASHFASAAKCHLEAAKHHEDGNHEKAAKSTVEAHGHSSLANEAQRDDIKHQLLKIWNY